MKMTMPKTFQPDPMLSAESAQRIQQKANLQAASPSQGGENQQSAGAEKQTAMLRTASTAMDVASVLPVGVKAKVALTAASYAATKVADMREGKQAGEQTQDIERQLGGVRDVALSTPESVKTQGVDLHHQGEQSDNSHGPSPG